jgi:hypothetical protein
LEIVSLETPVSLDTFSIPPHPITLAEHAQYVESSIKNTIAKYN